MLTRSQKLEIARARFSEDWPLLMRGMPSEKTVEAFKCFSDALWSDLISAINEEKSNCEP